MSLAQLRGGIVNTKLLSVNGTGRGYVNPFDTFFLKIRVRLAKISDPCLMFFTEADFDAGINYVTVPLAAAETPGGSWEGPVELQPGDTVWLQSSGSSSVVELVTFQRRG